MAKPRIELPLGTRLQIIKRAIFQPCSDKFSLLIETALPALGTAMWLLFTPSPGEILEEYLHPKLGRRGARFAALGGIRRLTAKANRYHRIFPGGIPDVDEAIANRLPGRAIFAGRQAGTLERWFWTGIDVKDKIGWWFLVYEVSNLGSLLWVSNILGAIRCHGVNAVAGAWDKKGCPASGPFPWASGAAPYLDPITNCLFDVNGHFIRADSGASVGGEFAWNVAFNGRGNAVLGPMNLKLFSGATLVLDEDRGSSQVLGIDQEGSLEVSGHWTTNKSWTSGTYSMVSGAGSGYRCDGYSNDGMLFGIR